MRHIGVAVCILAGLCCLAPAMAQDASRPAGDPVLEPPTLRCLGAYWVVAGDDNKNARVTVEYRKAGAGEWGKGADLFRVEKGAHKNESGKSEVDVPDGAWLFAGSVVLLEPDTEYEIRLKLADPDGGGAEKLLKVRTIAEPAVAADAPRYHVVPGAGGGSGTEQDPYRGLAAAQAKAKPGDVFLLHAGVYQGPFRVAKNGQPGRPIVWRGAGDGEAILDGGKADCVLAASDSRDVWFERLTIRNGQFGIALNRAMRSVVRRCRIHQVEYGIAANNGAGNTARGFFISDNVIEGPSTWPRTKGIENARGIQVTGAGHVVCYNRIRGFADAIDTFPSERCNAIDFHNNEISEMTDDGCEMDYSERNTRCFLNRFTNVYQGISVQPVFGGPVYIFRNALYNVVAEPFKMHNSPSGALVFHNTCVKTGMPLQLYTGEAVRHCVTRNNLFIGTAAGYAYETTAPMKECDFDYDGFGGGPWGKFLKWNDVRYATLDEVRQKAPIYKHALLVDPATAFASGVRQPAAAEKQYEPAVNDLRLKAGSAAIDAGQVLPGFNDGFAGKAPDLGAYELGAELPHYGPRE